MRTIRPIDELGSRVPEAGKIRLGIKTGAKGNPKAIDTFRFTSPYADVIDQLAAKYGGTPRDWDDAKAKVRNQREVITDANVIDVLVPPGGLSQFYELWSGSGCVRRCNGLLCEVPSKAPDEDVTSVPCICTENEHLECKPKTRMVFAMPDITLRGLWLLETSSWNAAEELVGMDQLLQQIQQVTTITQAQLHLQQRSQNTASGKRNFVVPVLTIPHTPTEIAAGRARLEMTGGGAAAAIGSARAALNAGDLDGGLDPRDDEPADAELVYTAEDIATRAADLANELILDPHKLLAGVCIGVSGKLAPEATPVEAPEDLTEEGLAVAADFLADVAAGRIEVLSFRDDGRLNIKRKE